MGSSKGRASGDRREHRKAAVIRREAAKKPTPRPAPPEPLVTTRSWPADPEPRPTSEQRTYFNRHLIGAIRGIAFVIVAGLVLVLVLGVGLLVVARGG